MSTILLAMEEEGKKKAHETLPLKLYDFYEQVHSGADGDLKNQDEFKNELYIYNGEIVDRDILGNILYGYLGRAYGFREGILYPFAGIAQAAKGFHNTRGEWAPFFFDDPRDQGRIRQGIMLYDQTH